MASSSDEDDFEFQSDDESVNHDAHGVPGAGPLPVGERQRLEEQEGSYLFTFCADVDNPALKLEQLSLWENDEDMNLRIVPLLEKYDLAWLSPIGAGGNSTVFKVPLKAYVEAGEKYQGSDPKYIVCRKRQLLAAGSTDAQAERARVWREFSIEAMILRNEVLGSHPNIVKLLSLDLATGNYATLEPPIFLYEHAELGCLSAFLGRSHRAKRSLGNEVLVKLCVDIGNGLDALQSQGVAHLDLKPENVLIMREGDTGIIAKIADFGCAVTSSVAYYSGSTPAWMAPEQLLQPPGLLEEIRFRNVARWDLYSFGLVVWYVFAAGRMDIRSQSLESILNEMAKHDPTDATLQKILTSLDNLDWGDGGATEVLRQRVKDCVGHLVRHDPRKRELTHALDCLDSLKTRMKTSPMGGKVLSAANPADACHRDDLQHAVQEGYFEVYKPGSTLIKDKLMVEDFSLFLERLPRRVRVSKALHLLFDLHSHPKRWATSIEPALPELEQWRREVANAPLIMSRRMFWPEVLLGRTACIQLAFAASRDRADARLWIGKAMEIEERFGYPSHRRIAPLLLPRSLSAESSGASVPPQAVQGSFLLGDHDLRFNREWCDGFFTTRAPEWFEELSTQAVWPLNAVDAVTVLGDTLAHYAAGSPKLLPLLRRVVEEGGCSPTHLNGIGLSPLSIAFGRGNSGAAHYLLDKVFELGVSTELANSPVLPLLFHLPDEDQQPLLEKSVKLCSPVLMQVYDAIDSVLAINLLQQAILLGKTWLPDFILTLNVSEALGQTDLEKILRRGMESCDSIHSTAYLVCFVQRWKSISERPIEYDPLIKLALSGCPLFWSLVNGPEFLSSIDSTLSFLIHSRGLDSHRDMIWMWIDWARRSGLTELIHFLSSFLRMEATPSDTEAWMVSRFILWSLEHEDLSSADLAVRHVPNILGGREDTPAFGFPRGLFPLGLFAPYVQRFRISNPASRRRIVCWLLDNGYSLRRKDLPVIVIWAFALDGSSAAESAEQSLAGLAIREEQDGRPFCLKTILQEAQITLKDFSYALYAILETNEPIKPLEVLLDAIKGLGHLTVSSLLQVSPSAVGINCTGNSFLDLFITTPLTSKSPDWKPPAIALLARTLQDPDLAAVLDHSDGLFLVKAVVRSDITFLDALSSYDTFRSYIASKRAWIGAAWMELDLSQASWDRRLIRDLNVELEDAPFLSRDELVYIPGPSSFGPDERKVLEIEVGRRTRQDYETIAATLRRFGIDGEVSPRDAFMQDVRLLVAALADMDIRPVILHHCVFGATLEDAIAAVPSLQFVARLSEVISEVLQLIDCRTKDTVPEQRLRFAIHERWSLGAQYTVFYLLGSFEQRSQVEEADPSGPDRAAIAQYRLTKQRLLTAQMKLQQLSTIFQAQTAFVHGDDALPAHISPQERCRYRLLKALVQYRNGNNYGTVIGSGEEPSVHGKFAALLDSVSRCRKLKLPALSESPASFSADNLGSGAVAQMEELEQNLRVGLLGTSWLNGQQILPMVKAHVVESHGLFLMILLEAAAWLRRLQLALEGADKAEPPGTAKLTPHLSKMADLKLRIAHALTGNIQQMFLARGMRPDPTQMLPRFLARLIRRENLYVSMPFHSGGLPPPGEDLNYLRFLAYHMYGHAEKALTHGSRWFEASRQAYGNLSHEDDRHLFDEEMDKKGFSSGRFAGQTAPEVVGQLDPATTQMLYEVAETTLGVGRRFREKWSDEEGLAAYPILKGGDCDLDLHVLALFHGEEPLGAQISGLLDGTPRLGLSGYPEPGSLWARIRDDLLEAPRMEDRVVLGVSVGSSLGLAADSCVTVELLEHPSFDEDE